MTHFLKYTVTLSTTHHHRVTHKGSYGYRYFKNARRKYPDCLTDSSKRLSVNRMAAGLRLQAQVMDFFFFHLLFKHALCSQLRALGLMAN